VWVGDVACLELEVVAYLNYSLDCIWREWGKPREASARITGSTAENRNWYLPSLKPDRYRSNVLGLEQDDDDDDDDDVSLWHSLVIEETLADEGASIFRSFPNLSNKTRFVLSLHGNARQDTFFVTAIYLNLERPDYILRKMRVLYHLESL
jgi:hypothetical protein